MEESVKLDWNQWNQKNQKNQWKNHWKSRSGFSINK